MPIRKNGDSIVFYDQAVQEWKKATVERYIRGYGYQVNYEEDGSSYQVEVVSSLIKTKMPTKSNRSRSRSRSVSRSRRTSRNVAKVLREPSPEDTKIIDDSKIEIETRINENGNEAVKDEEKVEKEPKKQRRGRSPLKKEALLVDWAWENVQGQSESRARDRRSRSRSRDRNPNTSVGEIIQEEEKTASEETPVASVEQTAEPTNENVPADQSELSKSLSLSSCPWWQSTRSVLDSILTIMVPLFILFYYDLVNGSSFLENVVNLESPLTWRQYWTSQPFVLLATAAVFLNRPIKKYFQPLQILGIAAYAHFAPQEYVFKWIPACAVGQIITVYALGVFVFYRHQKSEPIDGFVNKLTTFALGRETTCRIQTDLFHAGSLIGILISTFYVVGLSLECSTLCAAYQIISLGLNLFGTPRQRGFGLKSVFYSLTFIPFISTLLPRIIYNEENFEPDYWLIYTSFIGFLIGSCQKISALNRSKPAPNSSDLLITVSSLMLCPIQLKSLVILPLLVFSQ